MHVYRFLLYSVLSIAVLSYIACADNTPVIKGKTIEVNNFDTTVAPCNDFYQYANGGWLKNNPVPAAFSRWSSFNELADFNTTALRGLLETAANDKNTQKGSNQQKIGDFYFMLFFRHRLSFHIENGCQKVGDDIVVSGDYRKPTH